MKNGGAFEPRFRRAALLEEDGTTRPFEGAADTGILLGGQGPVDQGERARIGPREHGMGSGETLSGVGAHQGERADRTVERSADTVVETDRLGGTRLGRSAGGGLVDAAVGLLHQQDLVRPGQQAAVGHGLQQDRGARIAAHRQHLDALLDLLEPGRGEARQRLVEALGLRGSTAQNEDEECRQE
jgi:hypothetical protein